MAMTRLHAVLWLAAAGAAPRYGSTRRSLFGMLLPRPKGSIVLATVGSNASNISLSNWSVTANHSLLALATAPYDPLNATRQAMTIVGNADLVARQNGQERTHDPHAFAADEQRHIFEPCVVLGIVLISVIACFTAFFALGGAEGILYLSPLARAERNAQRALDQKKEAAARARKAAELHKASAE